MIIMMTAVLEKTMRLKKTLLGALLMLLGLAGAGHAASYSSADFTAMTGENGSHDPTL